MRGGDLHWIWSPYSLYQDIDYVRSASRSCVILHSHALSVQVYGLRAFENQEGFTNAQCRYQIRLFIAVLLITFVHSVHECRRKCPQYYLPVPRTRPRVIRCSSYWPHEHCNDAVEDDAVLAERVLLRMVLYRT